MAGHSHWKQIKHKKEAADAAKGQVFSKLLKAIAVAAISEANPDFNPRLRTAIEKAQGAGVPKENIERAVSRAAENRELEEIVVEAYGPGGAAFLIEAVTDNRNRTVAEIKHLLTEHGGKVAEPGSVRWAFEDDKPKFPLTINGEDGTKIQTLIQVLETHDDIQKVITNIQLPISNKMPND